MPGISNKDWILGHMETLPFVQWDRFTHDTWFDEAETVSVYGWIYREDDYKDFVLIRFWPQMEEFVFTTSSEKYILQSSKSACSATVMITTTVSAWKTTST